MSVKFQSAKSITLFKSLKRSKCLIQISWFHISKIEYFDSYIWFCLLNLYYSYNRLYFSVIIKEKPSPSPYLHSLFYHYRFWSSHVFVGQSLFKWLSVPHIKAHSFEVWLGKVEVGEYLYVITPINHKS